MNTVKRINTYARQNGTPKLTDRQRRRIVKKAGRDPHATVIKDDGMGYPPGKQGFREVICYDPASRPTSSAPIGTGRGHEAVDAILDEVADHEAERYRQGEHFS